MAIERTTNCDESCSSQYIGTFLDPLDGKDSESGPGRFIGFPASEAMETGSDFFWLLGQRNDQAFGLRAEILPTSYRPEHGALSAVARVPERGCSVRMRQRNGCHWNRNVNHPASPPVRRRSLRSSSASAKRWAMHRHLWNGYSARWRDEVRCRRQPPRYCHLASIGFIDLRHVSAEKGDPCARCIGRTKGRPDCRRYRTAHPLRSRIAGALCVTIATLIINDLELIAQNPSRIAKLYRKPCRPPCHELQTRAMTAKP